MSISLGFDGMSIGDRAAWLAWAEAHNWGGDSAPRYVKRHGKIAMETSSGDISDAVEIAYHNSPKELRDWAGY